MSELATIRKVDVIVEACARAGFTPRDWAWLGVVCASESGSSSREMRTIGSTLETAAAAKMAKRGRAR